LLLCSFHRASLIALALEEEEEEEFTNSRGVNEPEKLSPTGTSMIRCVELTRSNHPP
jgi:hypothetical protein